MRACVQSPISEAIPPMRTEDAPNWFNCNEEMRRIFIQKNETTN